MTPAEVTALLFTSPELFPITLDLAGDRVGMLRLDEDDYRRASFLDERLLVDGPPPIWAAWPEVEGMAATLRGESDYIFHIGHVGSTLLSRLLGADARTFALREPASLRPLATIHDDEDLARRLNVLLRLYARVWWPGQRSLVKATSFVSDIAPAILAGSPSAKAILMFVGPATFITTLLAGPASRTELPRVTAGRLTRLHRRLGGVHWSAAELSEGEMAAAGWACEICALARVASEFADRVLWLDFDRLLARPGAGLAAILRRLHGEAKPAEVATLLESPELHRYSKAPDHPFDARARRDILDDSARRHGPEIERGLAWINAAGGAHPVIARAARMAAAGRDP